LKSIFVSGSTPISLPGQGFSKGGHLLELLTETGFQLSKDPKSDFLIMFDHNSSDYRKYMKCGGHRDRSILIRLEPPAIYPNQYRRSVESKYARIYTPGSILNLGKPEDILGWVYRYDNNPVEPTKEVYSEAKLEFATVPKDLLTNWQNRQLSITMVAANKVSPVSNQNYGLRRKMASQVQPDLLSVYGPLWNDSYPQKIRHRMAVMKFALTQRTFPNLTSIYGGLHKKYHTTRGQIPDKHEVMKNSKFCIVVENSNTYFSEKLFDALWDGTIPLYIGPEIEKYLRKKNIGINISGNPTEILDLLDSISDKEIIDLLQGGRDFIQSTFFKDNWTEEGVYKRIAQEILIGWNS
jgi:hypothetical protein